MQTPIRILFVGRSSEPFDALVQAATDAAQLTVVGRAYDARAARRRVARLRPGVLVTDPGYGGTGSIETIASIRQGHPDTRTIVLGEMPPETDVTRALSVGVRGFLLDDIGISAFHTAVRKVASGEHLFTGHVAPDVPMPAKRNPQSTRPTPPSATLSPREIEVLRHLAAGLSVKEIARLFHRSAKTVDNQKSQLMAKLGIHDRVELCRFAIREGFITA